VFWYWVNSNYFPWNAHEQFLNSASTTTPADLQDMFQAFLDNYLQLRELPDSKDAPEDATVYISTTSN